MLNNTKGPLIQPRHLVALLVLLLQAAACHRQDGPEIDPRLPAAFRTPEAAFATWIQASIDRDERRLRECYFDQIPEEELLAFMRENLRPEALPLFQGATLLEVRPVRPVETQFRFRPGDGSDDLAGILVLSRDGWKILRW
jgi:hypothetical protein